jgi:ATP-binding cassette subfamily B protein
MKTTKPPLTIAQFARELLRPYRGYLVAFMMIGLCWALVNTALPYVLKMIIDHVVSFQRDKTFVFASIQNDIVVYVLLWMLLCFNMRLLDWTKLKLFPSLREDSMNKMFDYLGQHSYHYFQNNFAGSLINKVLDMQGGMVDILTILDDVYAQCLGLIVAAVTLFFVHPVFVFILMAWVSVFLIIALVFVKPIAGLSHAFAQARSSVVGKMVDSISNIVNVRLFARHAYENEGIRRVVADAVAKDRNMQKSIICMRLFWDASIIILLASNLWMLGSMYSQNLITVGDFSFVMSISISILWNLWFVAGQFVAFSEQVGKCNQALSIMHVPHDIVDAASAKSLHIHHGMIEFRDVSFSYPKCAPLFEHKNVCIQAGEKVGLVGFSGSGKSTFVNLMLRLFEVDAGAIYLDDQSIAEVTQQSLRENIALIPQDVSLFHRSLMDNIRYGNVDATDDEVIEASKKAHCHEFIAALPEGYESLVGERGVKLSGGQRQRIAIARAMLKNAPILILDEATSALDSVTEKYIQDALHALMKGKTTIVIAHRLSTLAEMDRILVFERGHIIESGMHHDLIQQKGHYATMWHMQAGGFLPEHAVS